MTGTAEWLERRRSGIGGSDVAAILGLSPFAGPFDVWLEKTGKKQADEDDTEGEKKQKIRGNVLEPAVASWYANELGVSVTTIPQDMLPLRHGVESWMTGSPDRMVTDTDSWHLSIEQILDDPSAWGMEAKTARERDGWGETGSDILPVYYLTQGVWYMAITKKERWDYAVYFPFYDDFRHYTIHRDIALEEDIIRRVTEWREKHIVGGEMPQIDGSEGAGKYLLDTYRTPKPLDRDATDAEVDIAMELKAIRDEKKRIEEREDLLANLLKSSIGEHRGIRRDGWSILWSAVKGRTTVDTKRLAEEYPQIYAELVKTGQPYRSFKPNFGKDK